MALAPKFSLLAICLAGISAGSASPASQSIGRDLALIEAQRAQISFLLPAADSTAEAIVAGHHLFLAGDPIWVGEGYHRAGGTQAAEVLTDPKSAKPGDVVWLAHALFDDPPGTALAVDLQHHGCLVFQFGPARPSDASASSILLGNILSLWMETGELASALARRGRTLIFLQSHVVFGSYGRETLYGDAALHSDWPVMKPLPPGALGSAYIDRIQSLIESLQKNQAPKIDLLGRDLARRARSGRPAVLVASGGHIMHRVIATPGTPFRIYHAEDGPAGLGPMLTGGDLLVFFGYSAVPLNYLAIVHRAHATAAWIVSPLPGEVDYGAFGDSVIDQQWKIGDAAVEVPGYDIRILPPSGVMELVIYRALLSAARS